MTVEICLRVISIMYLVVCRVYHLIHQSHSTVFSHHPLSHFTSSSKIATAKHPLGVPVSVTQNVQFRHPSDHTASSYAVLHIKHSRKQHTSEIVQKLSAA